MRARFPLSPKWIMGSQYFLYFGVLGIFLPYFNLYCYRLDFSGFQIGTLSAARSLTLILFPLVWGALADRFDARRPIYLFCMLLSTLIWAFYLFTADYWLMMGITVLYGIFFAPIISFMEAFSMDILGREKKRYGRIRVWGSLAFILAVLCLGRLIEIYSADIILECILAGSAIQLLFALRIPAVQNHKKRDFTANARLFLKPRTLIFLFCAFLMLVSHGTYYGFFSIHLENLGYKGTFIGVAWALASVSEIGVMVGSDRILKRFSPHPVLVFSFFIAAIRWTVLCFVSSPVAILLSQLFHAVTYGSFHIASILYMDKLSPGPAKTLGQAINNALTYGLGMMVGFFANGYLFERLPSFQLFGLSGIVALFGGLVLAISGRWGGGKAR